MIGVVESIGMDSCYQERVLSFKTGADEFQAELFEMI
jgi:hypothetical protein